MVPIYILIIFVQLFYFTIGYVNLARNKPAWQTSIYGNNVASNAVDGNTNQDIRNNSCALIIGTTNSGTWRVDLGRIHSIHHIKIFYRTKVSTWRMAGFSLYVSNTTNKEDGHLCFHELQTSPPPYIMSIDCIQHARYVIYYNERNKPGVKYPSEFSSHIWNALCEVEVYGCDKPGFYGQNCSTPCPINCKGNYCKIVNGTCLTCIDGYQGLSCEQTCAQGTYGLDCKIKCSTNCKYNQCNHVDGQCNGGCETGYAGNFCENDCPDSTYGENCGSNCGHCLNDVTCQHVSGSCQNGCAVGWKENKCDSLCDSGTYGLKCNRTCNVNCYSNTSYLCHYVNGNCTTGCKPGWQSPHCDQVCDPGKYGSGCNQSCNENCNGTQNTCDHATGECINGCKPGWKGEKCDTDACTDESVFQLKRTEQSNILLIGAIVGWVFDGIFIVSLIIFLTLHKLRKKGTHKDNKQIYDDINMDRREEHHVYSSITSKN